MKAVVDTNVVAYFLLGTEPFAAEARRLLASLSSPMAPALWEAEIANVLWMAIRTGVLPADEGPSRLNLAADWASSLCQPEPCSKVRSFGLSRPASLSTIRSLSSSLAARPARSPPSTVPS